MSMDRAEKIGTGAALAFHVALVAALSLHLAKVETPPEPPSMGLNPGAQTAARRCVIRGRAWRYAAAREARLRSCSCR